MEVVTTAEMKLIDHLAIDEYGIPGIVLMENAGLKVTEAVCRQLGGCVRGKMITIFAGKGNNGGDGLVVARHLYNQGADVRVLMMAHPDGITGDAGINLAIWCKMGQKIYHVYQANGINMVKIALMNTDLIVDALYGTGFQGTINEKTSRIITLINTNPAPVIAVDIPSGVAADTGKIQGACVKATVTITFGLPKLGLVLPPGSGVVGKLAVVDISLPAALLQRRGDIPHPPVREGCCGVSPLNIKKHLLDTATVSSWLTRRKPATHKGDFGRVLVLAGSTGMTGAAVLTATACLRSGAGLVTLAVPAQIHDAITAKVPEIITLPLPDTGGALSSKGLVTILAQLAGVDVLAIGPGLSQNPETVKLVQQLLPQVKIPLVVDADGLNALAPNKANKLVLKNINAPVVLTPHPGEMARLLGVSGAEVQEKRLELTLQQAQEWDCTVLLKGERTLVAAPDGRLYINPTGNPGMATAGSGDVLTGIITGLIAQGMETTQAAAAGAYLHGWAGDQGSADLGEHGLLAGDILKYLPRCFKAVYG
ncbi:MAG: NAD(P)H-hydrate dehydratase [Desulfotomaculum sp.]|nr:NAD(P)H-hydrate dehydratase [Desulfotomaculum sp.]